MTPAPEEKKKKGNETNPATTARLKKIFDNIGKTFNFFKKRKKLSICLTALTFIGVIIWWGMQPITGSVYYGVCRLFAQMQIRYPETMTVTAADPFESKWRVYYTYRDEFGYFKSDLAECTYKPDPRTGFALESVKINRQDVEKDIIESFNKSLPVIMATEIDLIMPFGFSEELSGLKTE